MKRIWYLIFRLLFLLDDVALSLRNLSMVSPRAVLAGSSATLRCGYDLEGAALYSIRWYLADTEFYRYVPREHPPKLVFPLPGAAVDLAQSDAQQVRVLSMNRRLSGEYQCEVSADAPLFHTAILRAPLTVVDPPFRAPQLSLTRETSPHDDIIVANCSVDEAFPAPNITWILDDTAVAESVSRPAEAECCERGAVSRLRLARDGPERARGLHGELLSVRGEGALLRCSAHIYDVYARRSPPAPLPPRATLLAAPYSGAVRSQAAAASVVLAAAAVARLAAGSVL